MVKGNPEDYSKNKNFPIYDEIDMKKSIFQP